ncbi:AsmA family protein [Magnetovirga frankeli]|uniref:AsmA family protein n=1 Tax=Magnetovirga frankeli TaxID=947516 RepID=UPI001293604B|nr:AsmA family protein [gamma proteobacterium SS-5]
MKLLFKILGLLLMLLLVAALALPLVLDPNDFKQQITEQVERHTGRPLQLGGDIRLSYFPWLGVELERVSLGNAKGFGDRPFAQVDEAGVKVKLLPLLQQRLEVDTLVLKGFKAHLIQEKDGRNNWQDLIRPSAAGADTGADNKARPLAALLIGGIELSDGLFIFEDRAAGRGVQLTGLNLSSGQISPGLPVDIGLSSQVQPLPGGMAFSSALSGQLNFDPASQRLSIQGLKLRLAELNGPQSLELRGQLELDTRLQLLNLRDLHLNAALQPPGASQTMNLSLDGQLAANIHQRHISLSPLSLRLSPLPGVPAAKLDAHLNLDLAKGLALLDQIQANFAELDLRGQLQAENLLTQLSFKGKLELLPFKPRRVLAGLGLSAPQTTDPVALTQGSLKLGLSGNLSKIDLTNIQLSLDDSLLSGNASIALAQRPRLGFDLKLNGLDLNRYLPPPAAGTARTAESGPLPLALLFALDMQGQLGIGRLALDRFRLENIGLKLTQAQGKLRLEQNIGNLYQGKYSGLTLIDASAKPPTLDYQAKISGVQAEPLLKAISGEDRLRGKGDVSIKLRSQGNTGVELRNRLHGDVQVSFRDGAIKGFNLAQTLREAKARIAELQGKEPPPEPSKVQETDFSALDATAKIQGSLIHNTSMQMKSPFLRFEGQGQLDSAKSWLDYRLTAVVVESSKGQGGKDFKELTNIPIPMSYQGPLEQMGDWRQWKVHLDQVIKAKVKQRAEEEGRRLLQKKLGLSEEAAASEEELKRQLEEKAKAKLEEKLQQELEEKASDGLKDVLKRLF